MFWHSIWQSFWRSFGHSIWNFLKCVWVQACPTASGAGNIVSRSRSPPQFPELATWCVGPGVTHCIRSWQSERRRAAPLSKSRDPHLAGGEKQLHLHTVESRCSSLMQAWHPQQWRVGICQDVCRLRAAGALKGDAPGVRHGCQENVESKNGSCHGRNSIRSRFVEKSSHFFISKYSNNILQRITTLRGPVDQ